MRVLVQVGFVCLMSACGGGGGGSPSTQPTGTTGSGLASLLDTSSAQVSDLALFSINNSTQAVASNTGTIDRSASRFSITSLDGIWSGTSVTLTGGGIATVDPGSNSFSATFSTQPLSGDAERGVVGIPSDPSTLTGTASYTGTTALQINDSTALFDLEGASTLTADFATGLMTVTLENLNGTRASGTAPATSVANVATVTLSNVGIAGNRFSGGTAAISSTSLATSLSGSQTVVTAGGFFGPLGDEAGGVVVIDDTTVGALSLSGTFLAD
ncbi:MAG: transferrin-binding protein-like solute binding protein [Pseudomonadota bacterium]